MTSMRVLVVEDEPFLAEAVRDGLRLEAIAADIARDGDVALDLLGVNNYDIAVLDRDVPGPSGDEIAERIVASGSDRIGRQHDHARSLPCRNANESNRMSLFGVPLGVSAGMARPGRWPANSARGLALRTRLVHQLVPPLARGQ